MGRKNNLVNKTEAVKRIYRQKTRNRVDIQVSVLTAMIVIISCGLIFGFNYYLSYNSMIKDLKDRALNIHEYLESRLDTDSFSLLENRTDEDTALYKQAKQQLEDVKNAAGVRYLYTAKKNSDGTFVYVVDGLPSYNGDFRHVGDLIEPECIPDMQRALSGKTVLPENITKTTWGTIFISYFPMHDGDAIVGVIGIEFDAENQYRTFRTIAITTPIVIVLSCLIAAVVAVFLFRRISNPAFRDMANTDFLTGLKNRNAFEVKLHNLEQKSDKFRLALLSLDLDGLKQVNDTKGHAAGDRYIKNSSEALAALLGNTDELYRIGGDEFVAVIEDKEQGELDFLAEEVQKIGEETGAYKISCGFAVYDPQIDSSLFDTLKRSDKKMYEEKRKRKQVRGEETTE